MKAKLTPLYHEQRKEGGPNTWNIAEVSLVVFQHDFLDPEVDWCQTVYLVHVRSLVNGVVDIDFTRTLSDDDTEDCLTREQALRWAIRTFDELVANHSAWEGGGMSS